MRRAGESWRAWWLRSRRPSRLPEQPPAVAVIRCRYHGPIEVGQGYRDTFRNGEAFEVRCERGEHYVRARFTPSGEVTLA